MMVTFICECEKKALNRTRRVLDAFANRIGSRTWQTVITEEGLQAVKKLLRKSATKNTAVACHWIRSRSRSELVWVVGNRSKFDTQGIVPVNYTEQEVAASSNEMNWQFLPIIESLTVFAALLHDFGKTTVLFQNKLRANNKTQSDPLRHEWISLLFLVAIVNNQKDAEWLNDLISDEVHKKIAQLNIDNIHKPLACLPPVASMVAWLIVSHHKLPVLEEGYKGKNVTLSELFKVISSDWGYANAKGSISFEEWFEYTELPSKSIEWQQEVKACAIHLKNKLSDIEVIFRSELLRPVMSYARLCLMLGDHFYSSQPKDANWHSSVKLFANTDVHNKLKQQLDEHLVGVAKQARENCKKLPKFEGVANRDIRVNSNQQLGDKSPSGYEWQDEAVTNIEKWKQKETDLDKHQYGFFAVNIASTGKGKTFANAKIMQVLSADEESLRYILALGLRTLTLQTGNEYKDRIGLKDDELAVLIGSKAILDLHQQNNQTGSESDDSLLDNEIFFAEDFPDQGLDTVLRKPKDRQFFYAPVLACTIDHIIQATEVNRGGRYILPTLRLMSSDLVIDEIDDFDNEDLIAIGRLIHLAGMLGRKVMISSATIPPDMAEGYFNVYQAGWRIFAQMRGKKISVGCAWIDEFETKAKTLDSIEGYAKEHEKFIKKRIANLAVQVVKRKANIAPCSTDVDLYFDAIKQAILEKHQHHHFEDPKTGKKISLGVVRVANIDPCAALTRYLLQNYTGQGYEIKAMAYHSQQVLLMRHTQEQYLDSILKRKNGNDHILEDRVIREHIDQSNANHLIFVLVATPVEEVGRDHDFDWAVIEPSSYRSFIQLAGRVLRHREKEVTEPNIAIMKYNFRALKNQGKKVAFIWPGYQQTMDDLTSYDLEKLVNTRELAEKLDATNRIQKTQSSELASLEHKVIHELLTNYDVTGPETLQGWVDSEWWLTGLPQEYVKFRQHNQDTTLYLTTDHTLLEKGSKGSVAPVGKDSVRFEKLSEPEIQNLWLTRSYEALIAEQSKRRKLSTEETVLIYGEINFPTYGKPLKPHQFVYNEQLGLTSELAACTAVND